jgi:hypothetical protein
MKATQQALGSGKRKVGFMLKSNERTADASPKQQHRRDGSLRFFDAITLQFVPGLSPTLQFPLFEFCPVQVLWQSPPAGEHVFCLGVDMAPNA